MYVLAVVIFTSSFKLQAVTQYRRIISIAATSEWKLSKKTSSTCQLEKHSRPHSARITLEEILDLGWYVLTSPLYSANSIFFVLNDNIFLKKIRWKRLWKKSLTGKQINFTCEQLTSHLMNDRCEYRSIWSIDGTLNLVHRWYPKFTNTLGQSKTVSNGIKGVVVYTLQTSRTGVWSSDEVLYNIQAGPFLPGGLLTF